MSSPEQRPPEAALSLHDRAMAVSRDINEGAERGHPDCIGQEAVQELAAAVCRLFAARQEAGEVFPILSRQNAVTSTDVMIACSALLKAADLQVFELGMWSSWTGR